MVIDLDLDLDADAELQTMPQWDSKMLNMLESSALSAANFRWEDGPL